MNLPLDNTRDGQHLAGGKCPIGKCPISANDTQDVAAVRLLPLPYSEVVAVCGIVVGIFGGGGVGYFGWTGGIANFAVLGSHAGDAVLWWADD